MKKIEDAFIGLSIAEAKKLAKVLDLFPKFIYDDVRPKSEPEEIVLSVSCGRVFGADFGSISIYYRQDDSEE